VSRNAIIEQLEAESLKKDCPKFEIGDTVRVHTKIVEGNKERIQVYEGIVIAKKGKGLSETFSVYRIAYGSRMEKVFILHSPRVVKVEVVRSGKVRRAKLYYLRGKTGKGARLKERYVSRQKLEKVLEVAEEKAPAKEENKAEEVKTEEAKTEAVEEPKEEPKGEEEKAAAEETEVEAEAEKPEEEVKKEEKVEEAPQEEKSEEKSK